jgi:hypothetical protein
MLFVHLDPPCNTSPSANIDRILLLAERQSTFGVASTRGGVRTCCHFAQDKNGEG